MYLFTKKSDVLQFLGPRSENKAFKVSMVKQIISTLVEGYNSQQYLSTFINPVSPNQKRLIKVTPNLFSVIVLINNVK